MVNPWRHQFYDFLRLIGLRDRLRCPRCRAVGTFKPHGGWLDVEDERKVRRWICKWCGLYRGPEGELQAGIGPTCWTLEHPDTPKSLLYDKRPHCSPWHG
jgi:hypothetical protein